MFKSYYKINIDVDDLSLECLQFKASLQRAVNHAIDSFYYNEAGDFKKFCKDLEIIRKNFSTKVDEIDGAGEVFHQFEGDMRSFKNLSKQLEGISGVFYPTVCLKVTKKAQSDKSKNTDHKASKTTRLNNSIDRG